MANYNLRREHLFSEVEIFAPDYRKCALVVNTPKAGIFKANLAAINFGLGQHRQGALPELMMSCRMENPQVAPVGSALLSGLGEL